MTARDALKMAGVAIDGIDLLAHLAGIGGPADAVLTAVKTGLEALAKGNAGTMSAQAVVAQLDLLHDGIKANNAAADAYEAAKFGTKP
jgi:hypothetical protein